APAILPRAAPRHRALLALLEVRGRRREAVHADAVLDQVHGRGAREVQQAALARGVGDIARLPLMPRRRDDNDDAAASPLLDHEAGDVLGAEEGARQVDADLAVPALDLYFDDAASTENPGVVHE